MSAEHYSSSFEDSFAADQPELEQELNTEHEQSEVPHAGSFERGFAWDSNLETIDDAENKVIESLAALKWPQEKIDDFALAVREAVTNAVVHGNLGIHREADETLDEYDERRDDAMQGASGKKRVNMEIYASEREVKVAVTDEGGFIAEPKPVADFVGESPSLVPSGRGLKIIFDGCDDVETGPGRIMLIKYRDGRPKSVDSGTGAEAEEGIGEVGGEKE